MSRYSYEIRIRSIDHALAIIKRAHKYCADESDGEEGYKLRCAKEYLEDLGWSPKELRRYEDAYLR